MPKRSLIEQLDKAVQAMLSHPDAPLPAVDDEIAALVRIAAELRDLPRETVKARLQADFERRKAMASVAEVAAPAHPVATPRLTFKDAAKAIEFYKEAFGARETFRFDTEHGIGHASIMIGDTRVMLAEEWPEGGRFSAETLGSSPMQLVLRVDDVDAFAARAVAAGLKPLGPIQDQFYGHRDGRFVDPFGYTWTIFTVKEELSAEELRRRFDDMRREESKKKPAGVSTLPRGFHTVTPYVIVQDAPALIEFVKQTFGAEQTFRTVGSAGGVHAEVRLGDSMLMMGGGSPELSWRGESQPAALHVYVEDADAVYRRALVAGATSVEEPTDQPYGDREAGVKDRSGNYWWIATHKEGGHIPQGLRTVTPFLHPLRAEPLINFLKRAFGAVEVSKYASPDGVVHHAMVRIGDSAIEMGEAHGTYQPLPTMFYLYVPDVDALYQRAVAAGASSIHEPADQPYGDRVGAVKDAFGNQWWIATHIKDVAT